MPQRDRVRLEWRVSDLHNRRTRALAWTCDCRATVYELCAGGGQAFIRRNIQLDDGHQVHETSPVSTSETWALWVDLLSSAAR
ncbi:hypothetical protein [Nonomuraea indica]|uniref:hypothetical protein n=1 Tax=Nonomuraea indica TaxID=1581193 RepID=UPI000C7ABB8D|nr:hypothetical protein [Nonomuraea indica]